MTNPALTPRRPAIEARGAGGLGRLANAGFKLVVRLALYSVGLLPLALALTYRSVADDWLQAFLVIIALNAAPFLVVVATGVLLSIWPTVTAGDYELFSSRYLRWLQRSQIAEVVVSFDLLNDLAHRIEPLRALYFRLVGVRAEPGVIIAPGVRLLDPDLVCIGRGAFIGTGALIAGHFVLARKLMLRRTEIGSEALIGADCRVGCGTHVGRAVRLGFGVIISEGVVIEEEAMVGAITSISSRTRIGARSRIGAGCKIGRECAIGAESRIGDYVILGPGVVVEPGRVVPDCSVVTADGRIAREPQVVDR